MPSGITAAIAALSLNQIITSPASSWVALAISTGPGAAGTSNPSSVTTRQSVTWNAPSAGSVTASNTPSWTSWAGTNGEVVTYTAYWTASTAGTFDMSIALSASVTMNTGDTLTLTSISVAITLAS